MTRKTKSHAALHRAIARVETGHRDAIETERNILKAARQRLDEVLDIIRQTAKKAGHDEAASDRYQQLLVERGRLNVVIARAERRIGGNRT